MASDGRLQSQSQQYIQTSKVMDTSISKYENFLINEDFIAVKTDSHLSEFCDTYNLKNLISEPTCYKNVNNPSSIVVILTCCVSTQSRKI